jgi:hypothetical protein
MGDKKLVGWPLVDDDGGCLDGPGTVVHHDSVADGGVGNPCPGGGTVAAHSEFHVAEADPQMGVGSRVHVTGHRASFPALALCAAQGDGRGPWPAVTPGGGPLTR